MSDKIITIPDELETAVENIEQSQRDADELKRKQKEAIQRKYQRIDRLRDEREDELKESAAFIFKWAREFAGSDIGQRIARLNKRRLRITIFRANFWLGQPEPKSTITVWAELQIYGGPKGVTLRYAEYHKGQESSHTDIELAPKLWRVVHPDFLSQCAEHLKSDDAFKYVMLELTHLQRIKS